MQAIRTFSNEAAVICAAICTSAFALMIATAVSNFLRVDVDTGDATFGQYMRQFTLPVTPLFLVLMLLVARQRGSATVVAVLATFFYLGEWLTL